MKANPLFGVPNFLSASLTNIARGERRFFVALIYEYL
jgi:hypothetical protein